MLASGKLVGFESLNTFSQREGRSLGRSGPKNQGRLPGGDDGPATRSRRVAAEQARDLRPGAAVASRTGSVEHVRLGFHLNASFMLPLCGAP